jgi:hypothetical protein
MTATTTLDLAALVKAIESRDASTQLAAYAPDAELVLVDATNPPSRPRVLRGTGEIGDHLADVCGRDMTHEVRAAVADGQRVALEVACRYRDGLQVLCLCVADVVDGHITRQRTVQAWDS